MATTDPGIDGPLRELAEYGAQNAHALPLEVIRRRAARRRAVRVVTGTVLAATIVAGAVFGIAAYPGLLDRGGAPVAAPAPATTTLTPDRQLDESQLVNSADVPADPEFEKIAQAPKGVGRSLDELSVCQPSRISELGARQAMSRNFFNIPQYPPGTSPDPDAKNPYEDLPIFYTAAFQFDSAEKALVAANTVQSWVADCDQRLEMDGYWVGNKGSGQTPNWVPVTVGYGQAEITTFGSYRPPGENDKESGYFEGIGFAVVGDRMMIAVHLGYGPDYNYGLTTRNEAPPHPLLGVLAAGAMRLNN